MQNRRWMLWVGLVLIAVGVLWTLQGLGYVGGSPMTGAGLWAVLGPLNAVIGVVLVLLGSRDRRADR